MANYPRRNWSISSRDIKNIYGLALVQLYQGASSFIYSGANLANVAKMESGLSGIDSVDATQFNFNVNPSELSMEEPAAVTIKPTQGGGKFIEHQGQIYKDIRLSGTTGLRPNRKSPSFKFGTIPASFAAVDPTTGLPGGERTGFDDLIQLRNLFRSYYTMKTDPDLASTTVMVWKNGKEGEYYIVEPLMFKTDRDSSSPLTARYEISLKTIGRLDLAMVAAIVDPFKKRNTDKRSMLKRLVTSLINDVNLAAAYADAFATAGQKLVTDILSPANNLAIALTNFSNSGKRFFDIPRNSVFILASNITEAARAMSSLIVASGNISRQKEAWHILQNMGRTVRAIFASDWLYSPKPMDGISKRSRNYTNPLTGKRGSGGDVTDLNNETQSSGSAQAVIGYNDDIRKLAKKLLGHAGRWKALVVLNGLKAPYISPDGDGIDVLRPGDYILYPASASKATAIAAESIGKHRTISPIEERLGRDIKLVSPTSAGGVTLFDFAVGDNGDVDLVEGVDNMVQGVRIKFETEQGELALHPFFGIKYPLGKKAPSSQNFIEFDVQARATILSDDRIGDIAGLDIDVEGNTIAVKADLIIEGFDSGVAVSFTTRR